MVIGTRNVIWTFVVLHCRKYQLLLDYALEGTLMPLKVPNYSFYLFMNRGGLRVAVLVLIICVMNRPQN